MKYHVEFKKKKKKNLKREELAILKREELVKKIPTIKRSRYVTK